MATRTPRGAPGVSVPPPTFFQRFGIHVARGVVADPILTRIQAFVRTAAGADGAIGTPLGGDEVNRTIRDVHEVNLPPDLMMPIERAVGEARLALERRFQLALAANPPISVLRYRPGGRYRPHRDRATAAEDPASAREGSIVVFLNDWHSTLSFQGGALRFYGVMGDPSLAEYGFDMEPEAGTLVAFSSRLLHEVTEVSRGVRCTAVCWLTAVK